jgi:hypothetical protein
MEPCRGVDGVRDVDDSERCGVWGSVGRGVSVDEGRGRGVDVGRGEYGVYGCGGGESGDPDVKFGWGQRVVGGVFGDIGDWREFEVIRESSVAEVDGEWDRDGGLEWECFDDSREWGVERGG